MLLSVITAARGHEEQASAEWAGGPFAEHAWLWQSGCATPAGAPDFLFRRWDIQGAARLFVLTADKPPPQVPMWDVTTRHYAPRLAAGARAHFYLRANPTATQTHDGTSQRHDVVTREKLRLLAERGLGSWEDWSADERPPLQTLVRRTCCPWLQDRAARHGFEIHEESLAAEGYQQHAQDDSRIQLGRRAKGESGVPFSTVDFSGELTVADPVTFGFALHRGIGRAKAFGCGLLLVGLESLIRSRT